MSSVRKMPSNEGAWPKDAEEYYKTLTSRNFHFVSSENQKKVRNVKVFVAGCGSTGGACIESLARIGVEQFILADNGSYELTNLNRQHAYKEDIGVNKAQFHADCLYGINPFARVKVCRDGVTDENITASVEWADIVIDAIDVTSSSGIEMKLKLHEKCHQAHKPTITALDIGFRQWGRSYDYRQSHLATLGGALQKAKEAKHPLKVLFSFVPLSAVPNHSLGLVEDLLTKKDISASQIGSASDLLSAIIVPVVIQFAATGRLVDGWDINLHYLSQTRWQRVKDFFASYLIRRKIKKILAVTL